MENDNINIITNNYINKDQEDVFVFDYKSQNMKNNLKFQEWKKKMDIKYKEEKKNMCIECPFENIYFYGIHFSHDTIIKCPSCDQIFCYYCLKMTNLYDSCCLRRKLIKMHYNGIMYSDSEYQFDTKCQLFELAIPGNNIDLLMVIIFNSILPKKTGDMLAHIVIINFLKFVLIIPNIILSFYISLLFIFLIIIRTKWCRYIIGFLEEGLKAPNDNTSKEVAHIIIEQIIISLNFLFLIIYYFCCCHYCDDDDD